ncbi:hypothetical protein [Lysinibacillus sp. TE18511]
MKIDWGSIADWVSGTGTIFAALIALYFGTRDNRIKLDIQIINDKFRAFGNEGHGNTYDVCVTNIRVRTVHIRSLGFYKRKLIKKKMLSKTTHSKDVLIASLAYGEMVNKEITFDSDSFMRLTGTKTNDIKKLYIGIEDISGKIYYKKFTP